MIKDPLTVWDGDFPYDVLAPIGVTPQSTHDEMVDASFILMTRRLMNPETQKAWNELRNLQRRLLADFLLYDVDPSVEIAEARARTRQELADPGEPPEVTAALSVPVELLNELSGELAEIRLEAPPPLRDPAEFGPFPPPALIDNLIRFDR